MREYGKNIWIFPDGFCPSVSTGAKSHDCISVVNTGAEAAEIRLTILFEEDILAMTFSEICPPGRSRHIRLDRVKDAEGRGIPTDTCYSAVVESDKKIVAQYSRLDTSQGGEALMTALGYSE